MFYAAIFFTTLILIFLLWGVRKPPKFPPGPKWYPIVGCALQISQLRVRYGTFCKVIDELAKYYVNPYGLYGLKIGKDKLVIAYYNDTINEMMTNEDMDGKPDGIFYRTRTFNSKKGILVTDEEFWVEQRRFILRHLKDFGFARNAMVNNIQNEAGYLVDDLKQRIRDHGGKKARVTMKDLFTVYVLNTLWTMLASKRYDRNSHEVAELLNMFFELMQNVDMIGALFSHFPFMRFIAPNYSGYNRFVETHQRFYAFIQKEVDNHRKTFMNNAIPRDLMDTYLRELADPNHKDSFSEEQLMAVCLDMFLVGSETTNKSIGFAFLHLVRNPEIQEKAFAEIKEVVGLERLPEWKDRPKLIYCEAIVLEALRMFMGNTFGIPHRALRDTRLSGYEIPKDTMVVGCFRGMLMNAHDFPNPSKFQPERYIVDGKLKVPEAHNPFGFGRHRCMGDIMGRQNLFLFTTAVLQNFKILPLPGELPDDEPLDGATAAVKPYEAILVPRCGVMD
ncbi:probable cytochrome P450 303a1 [Teleopsis dalmanni]|uniref:probable cytochrome P450 303a1 n=1 Tax=Teleopsis dalmanni TaxID=139649 RepID=UPI0018CEA80E|nr:probable cytochrome P450 303a1 [Teleopsis dalmanni]